MKYTTIGILAHVDAGKTTLIEQLLVVSGKKGTAGRVDHGTAFLDSDVQERARGITITSKMCRISNEDHTMIFVDTPGHIDFTAESERVLPVLDAAILVIGAGERIPVHAQYLFRLLRERSIPTMVFFNKMDLPVPGRERLMEILKETLGEGFFDWKDLDLIRERSDMAPAVAEEIALLDEGLMERFLETGELKSEDVRDLFRRGKFFPCCFGSALRGEGVPELFSVISELTADKEAGSDPDAALNMPLGAYCYKILHDETGQKVAFLRVLSGVLHVRDVVSYRASDEKEWKEKLSQLRLYDGASFQAVQSAEPGDIIAVTGLSAVFAGCGIGIAPSRKPEESRPMLRFRLILPEHLDARAFLPKLRMLEEEEDTLSVDWIEEQEEINVELYGEVQREILTERIRERFDTEISFDEGTVVYRETLREPSYGVGHFEPLRHYAEVHFLMEPLPRGTGILVETRLSTDELSRNWQQTILNALENEQQTGVLANAALTDIKLTLVAGRAHTKHTEGGDFREAALRAVRQGLMAGDPVLLEPYVHFTLTVPQEAAGRALYDMNQLASENQITEQTEKQTTIEGRGAISRLRNYMAEVRSYSRGEGVFRMIFDGYDICPEQEAVVERIGYHPEADLYRPAGSVFVDHGAAVFVPWNEVPARAHIEPRFSSFYPKNGTGIDGSEQGRIDGAVDPGSDRKRKASLSDRLDAIGTDEIDRILQQATHANQSGENASERRNRWNTANLRRRTDEPREKQDHVPVSEKESSSKGAMQTAGKRLPISRKKPVRKPYLLIDGYNIIHAWEETRGIVTENIDAARQILLDLLVDYRSQISQEIIVVFDAYRVQGHRTETEEYQNLYIVFTREAETADQYISRFALEHEKHYDITVATSDGLVQLIIRGADAKLMSARELREDVLLKKQILRETFLSD